MIRVFFICVWIALLTTFSCQQKPISYAATLLEIERFVAAEPDSAYRCLQAVDTTHLSRADQALYYLIRTETEDKLYIEHTTDSLIGLARIYFESVQDIPHLAKAWYLTGRIHSDWKDWEAATQDFLKARELTEHSTDYALKGRIANYLGGVNWDNNLHTEALPYYKEAYHYYSLAPDSASMAYALRNIGLVYAVTQKADSAVFYFTQGIFIAKATKNKRILSALYNSLGLFCKKAQRYEDAYLYLHLACKNAPKKLYSAYVDIGHLYIQMGKLDSARIYLQSALSAPFLPTRCMANYYLGELAHQEGKENEAYLYQKQYELLVDSLDNQKQQESVISLQYDHKQKEIDADHLAVVTSRNVLIIGLFVLALLAALFIYYLAKRVTREKQRHLRYEEEIRYLTETIRRNDSVMLKMKAEQEEKAFTASQMQINSQLTDENQQMLIRINELHVACCKRDSFLGKLYEKNVRPPVFSATEWDQFLSAFGSVYSTFIPNLQKNYPEMSSQDIRICAFSIMKLKTARLADTMDLQSSTLSSYKQRIKKSYFDTEEKKPLEEFLLRYIV